jgi:hypothetical protein
MFAGDYEEKVLEDLSSIAQIKYPVPCPSCGEDDLFLRLYRSGDYGPNGQLKRESARSSKLEEVIEKDHDVETLTRKMEDIRQEIDEEVGSGEGFAVEIKECNNCGLKTPPVYISESKLPTSMKLNEGEETEEARKYIVQPSWGSRLIISDEEGIWAELPALSSSSIDRYLSEALQYRDFMISSEEREETAETLKSKVKLKSFREGSEFHVRLDKDSNLKKVMPNYGGGILSLENIDN